MIIKIGVVLRSVGNSLEGSVNARSILSQEVNKFSDTFFFASTRYLKTACRAKFHFMYLDTGIQLHE